MLFSSIATITTCGLGRAVARSDCQASRSARSGTRITGATSATRRIRTSTPTATAAQRRSLRRAMSFSSKRLLASPPMGIESMLAGAGSSAVDGPRRPHCFWATTQVARAFANILARDEAEATLLGLFDASLLGRAGEPALDLGPAGGPVETLTFGELEARSDRMAHALVARGLRAGDRLAVQPSRTDPRSSICSSAA